MQSSLSPHISACPLPPSALFRAVPPPAAVHWAHGVGCIPASGPPIAAPSLLGFPGVVSAPLPSDCICHGHGDASARLAVSLTPREARERVALNGTALCSRSWWGTYVRLTLLGAPGSVGARSSQMYFSTKPASSGLIKEGDSLQKAPSILQPGFLRVPLGTRGAGPLCS